MTEYVNRKRGGRPPLPPSEVRSKRVEVWLNERELSKLAEFMEDTSASRGDVFRSLLMDGKVEKNQVPTVNRDTYLELARIGNNVNQLAKAANQAGYQNDNEALGKLWDLIQQTRRELVGVDDDS